MTERTVLETMIRAYAASWALATERDGSERSRPTLPKGIPSAFLYAEGTARSASSGIERWLGTSRSRSSLVRSS